MTVPACDATNPSARWRLAAIVCALVLGVLGMHALAMSCSTDDHSAMGMSAGAVGHTSHDGPADAAVTEDTTLDGGPVMGLCVALIVSLTLLWAALAVASLRGGWALPRRQAVLRPFVPTVRCRPPPSLAQLSVMRC